MFTTGETRLKVKATEIESKAGELKTTAEGKSSTELTDSKETDIKGDKDKGTNLQAKAGLLKEAAQKLSEKADALEKAATEGSTLQELKEPAEKLRDAAKKDTTSDGQDTDSLHYHAGQLESQRSGLETKATKVIKQFEEVLSLYKELMEKAKNIVKQSDSNVQTVDKAYKDLKEIYDGMLNLTKLAKTAKELKDAGTTLQDEANTLELNVKALRDNDVVKAYENAQTVIQNYETVDQAYNNVTEDEKEKVQTQFEALKKLYDKTFKFTKIKYYAEQLSTESNSKNVPNIITNLQKVIDAYNALPENDKSIVQSAYTNLRTEYSNAIYFYKFNIVTMPSMLTNWLNFLIYVILLVASASDPGRCGCPKPDTAAPAETSQNITSLKLAISGGGLTHKITLTPSGSGGTGILTYNSSAISLKDSGTDGTLIINLPGGEIKLTDLSISGTNLTIQSNGNSKVSVTKKPNPFDPSSYEKIKLKSGGATLNGTGSTLTINSDPSAGSEAPVTIGGSGSVNLNYSGSGEITIKGDAITALQGTYDPDELHDKHKSDKCCIYSKQYEWKNSENPTAVWWNIFNILMPLQISLAYIFIHCLHHRESLTHL